MSDRATQLAETAGQQIAELANILSATNDLVLRSACPGREKLGDGTVAAVARHTADTYQLIASFARGGHPGHNQPHGRHGGDPTERGVDLGALVERLAATRHAVNAIADLTDEELDTVPPAGAARFCDGQRTRAQVLTSMLNHQRHQVDAMQAAIGSGENGTTRPAGLQLSPKSLQE